MIHSPPPPAPVAPRVLIVVPTLNEAAHITRVIPALLGGAPHGTTLVVADGGSEDGTREAVLALSRHDPRVTMIDNPARLQAAGINKAVDLLADGATHILRADAHADYPATFCRDLLAEMAVTGAASVTVRMRTLGTSPFTHAVAAAQNSALGTGGSAHRSGGKPDGGQSDCGGRFVDHGHHALMRLDAFRAVGGYEASQSHNEDAELDHRLRMAGHRIWLSGRVTVGYHPRRSLRALMAQYRRHGAGRAETVMRHHMRLRPRQIAPLLVPPALALALVGVVLAALWGAGWLWLGLPAAIWAGICLIGGAGLALRHRRLAVLMAGPAAMAMHLGWGTGFLVARLFDRPQS